MCHVDKVIHSREFRGDHRHEILDVIEFIQDISDAEENIEIGDERFNFALICLFRQCEIHQWKLEIQSLFSFLFAIFHIGTIQKEKQLI